MKEHTLTKLNEEALFWNFLRKGDSEYKARQRAKRIIALQKEQAKEEK